MGELINTQMTLGQLINSLTVNGEDLTIYNNITAGVLIICYDKNVKTVEYYYINKQRRLLDSEIYITNAV